MCMPFMCFPICHTLLDVRVYVYLMFILNNDWYCQSGTTCFVSFVISHIILLFLFSQLSIYHTAFDILSHLWCIPWHHLPVSLHGGAEVWLQEQRDPTKATAVSKIMRSAAFVPEHSGHLSLKSRVWGEKSCCVYRCIWLVFEIRSQ